MAFVPDVPAVATVVVVAAVIPVVLVFIDVVPPPPPTVKLPAPVAPIMATFVECVCPGSVIAVVEVAV